MPRPRSHITLREPENSGTKFPETQSKTLLAVFTTFKQGGRPKCIQKNELQLHKII